MAKRASSKKTGAKAPKVGTYRKAKAALKGAGVPQKEFGKYNRDGTLKIDQKALEQLRTGGTVTVGRVKFVALNAPFKRRSPIPPA
jgi:hypothetical protein